MRHGAKVKQCSNEGCTNHAVNGGVCLRHGAKHKRCSIEGCTKYPQKGGLCIRHGAYRNTQDESTAFGSEHQNSSTTNRTFGSEHENTTTVLNQRASRSRGEEGRIVPSEVTILCQEIVEV